MSVDISFAWGGGKPPLDGFDLLKAMTSWSDEVGPDLLEDLKDATPKDTGMMAAKERYDRTTGGYSITMNFTAHSSYARYPWKGTQPHRIYPVAAKYLHFMGTGGGHVFVGPRGTVAPGKKNWVNHPGNRPNPFPERVLAVKKDEIMTKLHQYVHDAITGG